jgi:tryptophan-rich sensory protein
MIERTKKNIKLLLSLLICHSAGVIGSLFSKPIDFNWYAQLKKPFYTPPDWVFGPVWFVLYTLIGISLYLIWSSETNRKNLTILIFSIHLIFNAAWSILFFDQHEIFAAFFDVVIIGVMIGLLIFLSHRFNKWASYLLVPYLLWVSFAGILNFSIWNLNR